MGGETSSKSQLRHLLQLADIGEDLSIKNKNKNSVLKFPYKLIPPSPSCSE